MLMCTKQIRGVRSLRRGIHRRGVRVVAAAVAIWLSSIGMADAGMITVFDNYKPNFGTATWDGQVINPIRTPQVDLDAANAFVPTASGPVSDIWATVTRIQGVNEIDLFLMSDGGGAPDRVLEMWNVTNAMGLRGGLNPPVHVQGDGGTFLQAGETYWLVASAPLLSTVGMWMYNGVNDQGPSLIREDDGPWRTATGPYPFLRGAFRVDVVPEPATLCMMAAGALTVLYRRRRNA